MQRSDSIKSQQRKISSVSSEVSDHEHVAPEDPHTNAIQPEKANGNLFEILNSPQKIWSAGIDTIPWVYPEDIEWKWDNISD